MSGTYGEQVDQHPTRVSRQGSRVSSASENLGHLRSGNEIDEHNMNQTAPDEPDTDEPTGDESKSSKTNEPGAHLKKGK